MTWIDGRRMVPRTGASPAEVDRHLGFPRVQARREGKASCLLRCEFLTSPPANFPAEWSWRVQRGGSPGGPFQDISPWLPHTQPQWRDDDLPLGSENSRRPYYRVTLSLPREGSVDEVVVGYAPEWDVLRPSMASHGFTWEEMGVRSAYAPPVVRETRRRFSLLARSGAGMVAALYREAWMAGPCLVCTNPLTGEGQGDRSRCTSCLGTGKEGGFYPPLRVELMRPDAVDLSSRSIPQGRHDLVESAQMICPWWPIPESGDYIRYRDGALYSIVTVKMLDGYRYPVAFVLELTQVERTHPLSSLPLPEQLLSLAVDPLQQMGRAMHLEAYGDSLRDGAMAYGSRDLPQPEDE